MEIKILGSGCAKCKSLYEITKQAVEALGIEASLVKEEDMMKIISYNVMRTPAIVIDEKVVSQGKEHTVESAKKLIQSLL